MDADKTFLFFRHYPRLKLDESPYPERENLS